MMSPSHKGIAKRTRTKPLTNTKRRTTPKPKYPFEKDTNDTSLQGRHALEWLLHPIPVTKFFDNHFETKPLHLRNPRDKFRSLVSIAAIRKLVTSGKLTYSELDVTSYTPSAGRLTHNREGLVGAEAWKKFSSGCSLRLRRPQTHFEGIRKLCSLLESFLECVVGANIYLTRAHSQGFAAHFDDVEAVICQISGSKHWRIYKRGDEHDVLPRRSSVDFSKSDVEQMRCVKEVLLQPGEVLYLPRGAVHEARCTEEDSLHVTISFCQRWTWCDLLIGSFEQAVLEAAAVDKRLRETVPLRFGRIAGAGVDGGAMGERFGRMVRSMVRRVEKHYDVDFAADRMMERFVEGRLAVGDGGGDGNCVVESSRVVLVASGCVRLVVGEDGLAMLVGKGFRESCLPEEAGGIKYLLDEYPNSVSVMDIPLEKFEDRLELARGLVEMGVLKVV